MSGFCPGTKTLPGRLAGRGCFFMMLICRVTPISLRTVPHTEHTSSPGRLRCPQTGQTIVSLVPSVLSFGSPGVGGSESDKTISPDHFTYCTYESSLGSNRGALFTSPPTPLRIGEGSLALRDGV